MFRYKTIRESGEVTFKALLVTLVVMIFCVVVGPQARTQVATPPTGIQLGRPLAFIYPGELHYANNTITYLPKKGRVQLYAFNGTTYAPTGAIVTVDNPWPGISFGILQPVMVEQINGRWIIVSTTP